MLEKLRGSRVGNKHSVQFVSEHGRLSEPFYFADHKPHESSRTWQVPRQDFDMMMLDNARQHGVDVHEGSGCSRCSSKQGGRSASGPSTKPEPFGKSVAVWWSMPQARVA